MGPDRLGIKRFPVCDTSWLSERSNAYVWPSAIPTAALDLRRPPPPTILAGLRSEGLALFRRVDARSQNDKLTASRGINLTLAMHRGRLRGARYRMASRPAMIAIPVPITSFCQSEATRLSTLFARAPTSRRAGRLLGFADCLVPALISRQRLLAIEFRPGWYRFSETAPTSEHVACY
jgi:hypothetical protein